MIYDNTQLEFHGAAREVTGSKHLIRTPQGKKILLDCGLIQSGGEEGERRNRLFSFDPAGIDLLILSHAHIDHSGNIPNLVKQGFRGTIFTTAATADLLDVMLKDSARIQEDEVAFINKKRKAEGRKLLDPLYTYEDVLVVLEMIQTLDVDRPYRVDDEVSVLLTDTGHILGSVAINLTITKDNVQQKIFFSGDVGRYSDRILTAPQEFPQADYIILESTYGNRLHDDTENAEQKLLAIIQKACVENKGKLLIPAFSLGRTQEIVYAMDRMRSEGRLPDIDVYVDSPLAIAATKVMRRHTGFFNQEILDYMHRDPDPFGFANLKYTQSVKDSQAINQRDEACVIIASSGMMEAGRIKHHLTKYIEDEKNTVLIVGYCAPETLGGKILAGEKNVRIYGDYYQVKANVEVISSYSAHADYGELMRFLSCQDPKKVKSLFLVHGNLDAQEYFAERLNERGFENVQIPSLTATYQLEL